MKSLTITLYQTLMFKYLCFMMFETVHAAFTGASNRFGVVSFPALGKQTLLFINVASFHLTPIADLNRKISSFNLHSFFIYIFLLPFSKRKLFVTQQWPVLLLLLVLTPQKMTLLPLPVILPTMHYHSALKWLLLNPSQSFLSPP